MRDKKLRILMIEDSADDESLILRALKQGGYHPVHTRVEHEASMREALRGGDWDLILCDYTLPGFGAMEALKVWRACKPQIPFIIVTGTVGDERAVEAMKAGASDLILKESLARLCPAIERDLRDAREHRAKLEAERLLLESEEKYRTLIENIPDITWRRDERGRYTFVSPNVERISGLAQKAFYAQGYELWLSRIHPEDIGAVRSAYMSLIDERKMFDVEYRFQKQDGAWIWVKDRAVSVFERGGIRYADGIATDITERKRLERIKDEFLSTVSHELKTPITIIREAVASLHDGVAGEVNREQRHILDICIRNSDRLARLISDLLDIGRLESGKARITRVRLETDELMRDVIERFRAPALNKGISIETEVVPRVLAVYADEGMLKQVVANLLDNAVRYATGKVRVRAEVVGNPFEAMSRGAETAGAGSEGSNFLKVSVIDDGPGLDTHEISELFDKFKQLKRPAGGGGYKGTGLGLVISKEIVELHEGRIWCESQPGEGTRFHFVIPLTNHEP